MALQFPSAVDDFPSEVDLVGLTFAAVPHPSDAFAPHMRGWMGDVGDELEAMQQSAIDYITALGKVDLTGYGGTVPTLFDPDSTNFDDNAWEGIQWAPGAVVKTMGTQTGVDPLVTVLELGVSDEGTGINVRRSYIQLDAGADSGPDIGVDLSTQIGTAGTGRSATVGLTGDQYGEVRMQLTDTKASLAVSGETGQTDPLLDVANVEGLSTFKVTATEDRIVSQKLRATSDVGPSDYYQLALTATTAPDGTAGNASIDIISSDLGYLQYLLSESTSKLIIGAQTSQNTDPVFRLEDSAGNPLFAVEPRLGDVQAYLTPKPGGEAALYINDGAGNSRIQLQTVAPSQAISVHSESSNKASGDWGADDARGVQLYMEGPQSATQAVNFIEIDEWGGTPVMFAVTPTGALMLHEQADPSAPAADTALIYVRDNGGKSELVVEFNTGAVQQIAIEP